MHTQAIVQVFYFVFLSPSLPLLSFLLPPFMPYTHLSFHYTPYHFFQSHIASHLSPIPLPSHHTIHLYPVPNSLFPPPRRKRITLFSQLSSFSYWYSFLRASTRDRGRLQLLPLFTTQPKRMTNIHHPSPPKPL